MSNQLEGDWKNYGDTVYLPHNQGGFCLSGCPSSVDLAEKITRSVNACRGLPSEVLHSGDYAAARRSLNMAMDALRKYEEAFDVLFTSCCSNGVFNAWGGEVNCTALNEAHRLAGKVFDK